MRSLEFYRERITTGMFVILCFTVCVVSLLKVFYANADDEEIYLNHIHSRLIEASNPPESRYIPSVNKWDFEIMLPIAGAAGEFHWKVKGAFSANKNEREQCIYAFTGETMDEKNPIRLVSPEMIFVDDEKELYTKKSFFAEMGWGSISGTDMVLRLETDTVDVRKGVEVVLVVSALPDIAGEATESTEDAASNGTGSSVSDEEKHDEKESKGSEQLIITSDKLKILGKEDKAVFSGNVVGRDSKGTISADTMEVQNYSKDDRKIDPSRKGVKSVVCKGHVKIDLTDQAAKCHHAVFDAAKNTVTLIGTEIDGKYVQVEYWTKEGQQILCDRMVMNRETKEVEFIGNQQSTDYNPNKSSFLDFGLDDEKNDEKQPKDKPVSGEGQKNLEEK